MTRRTKMFGFGVGLLLVGLFLAWNGFWALGISSDEDDGGYVLTDDPLAIEVSSRAVVTNDVELLRGGYGVYSVFVPIFQVYPTPDDVRVRGVAQGSETLFIGLAPADAVAGYLDGVVHDEITDWDWDYENFIEDVVYTRHEGTIDPAAPGTEGFWVASVSGSGEQTLDWTIQSGEWAVVIMNADGLPGVSADVRFGVLAPSGLVAVGWISLVAGLVALIGGGLLVYLGPRRRDVLPPPDPTEAAAHLTQETGTPASADHQAGVEQHATTTTPQAP